MKKVSILSLIVLVALGVGAYFMFSGNTSKAVKYRTDKITKGSIILQVRSTGTLNPVRSIDVGSQVSGTIAKLNVDYNSPLKKGEIMAIIDSTFLWTAVEESKANVDNLQAQVNKARRDLVRADSLFANALLAASDLDVAKTAFETDTAQLEAAKAALQQQQVNLAFAVIRSPVDGVVIERDVDVGTTVASSLSTPKLFGIATDLKNIQVWASVDEADVGQVKEGELVSFTVEAYPDQPFMGHVLQVRLDPITVQNVVTYTVIIDVKNDDLKLRPGMTATVSILIDKRDSALRFPALATRFNPPQDILDKFKDQLAAAQAENAPPAAAPPSNHTPGADSASRERHHAAGGSGEGHQDYSIAPAAASKTARLWVLDANNNLRPVIVKTGLSDSRYVEILSGDVNEGDTIVLGIIGVDNSANASASAQSNPFAPRMPGGGGRAPGR
jgi:HlyD family secretion protein